MVKTRLIIARHGNTFGPGDIVTRLGKTDLPLVESGLEQGRMIGAYLKHENIIPDVIFTSELKRTQQTAEQAQAVMGTSLPLQHLTIFNEIDYGPDENKPETEVVARLGEAAIKAWDNNCIVPDGWKVDPAGIVENWKKFADKILHDYTGKTTMVVTSNGIARFSPCLDQNFNKEQSVKLSTGAVCLFEYDGAWKCLVWNLKPKQ